MKHLGTFLLAVLVCANLAEAQSTGHARMAVSATAASPRTTTLPIRRVILYSNGVAYIERRGVVTGNAEVNLSFKQSQIDDVLKSMVVLDLGQGRIGAVSYNSSAPVSARMAEIPFSVTPTSTDGNGMAGVLSQLQGARVSVTSARGTFAGSILTIERKTIRSDKDTSTTNMLVIASETGELSSFDLSEIRGLKLLEEGTRSDVMEFATASASARRLDAKTITVTSVGTGQREMVVSYTIAAPIWKTTYRVVLDEAGKPYFQGWAIVDNISEEDWSDVQMSLVSGSPISFIQNLQKPFYRYRPVIPIPEDLQLRPQVYEPDGGAMSRSSVISGVISDPSGAVIPNASVSFRNESTGQTLSTTSDSYGRFSQSGLPPGTYTIIADASGFNTLNVRNTTLGRNLSLTLEVGSISETVQVTASQIADLPLQGRSPNSLLGLQMGAGRGDENFMQIDGNASVPMAAALTSGQAGITAAATGDDIGDMFEYKIDRPVTVLRNRSALIPIVQTQIDGERVAIYNEAVRRDRPFSGVLLKNTTNLTLEAGSMTVIDGNAYAGEALMERLKAKEQRLISFALDLGTNIRVRPKQEREPASIVKAVNGVLQIHYFQTEEKLYSISNLADRPKVVYVEFPIRSGWALSDDSAKPDSTTQSFYRFRVEVGAMEEKELNIILRNPRVDTFQIGSVNRDQLALFVSRRYIDEATRSRLERLIEIRGRVAEQDQRLRSLQSEMNNISADQKRLRENIESLAKTAEAKQLITRYIAKANEQETRLEQIEAERKAAQAEKERLERELAVEIKNFEVK
ncbi:MAG: carboxypeptidase regulatory-like domain-containing protein [Acidobacteria bacterium]|nr:carboxypeptidase regulatory-like domain-containing protein [Acidobacteriota bacterium]